jgi:phosphoglycolate phosphatase
MIGDRFYDIDGAKATNLESAGALFGLGEVEELTEAGATYLLNDPSDLLNIG